MVCSNRLDRSSALSVPGFLTLKSFVLSDFDLIEKNVSFSCTIDLSLDYFSCLTVPFTVQTDNATSIRTL